MNDDSLEENGKLTIMTPNRKLSNSPLDTYLPTPKELDILQVMMDPWNRNASISAICEKAGVARQTYFNAMRKPEFMEYYQAAVKQMVKEYGAQLMHIGMREAKKGSFQHWKVMAEIAQLHIEKKQVEHDGEMVINVRFADPDGD